MAWWRRREGSSAAASASPRPSPAALRSCGTPATTPSRVLFSRPQSFSICSPEMVSSAKVDRGTPVVSALTFSPSPDSGRVANGGVDDWREDLWRDWQGELLHSTLPHEVATRILRLVQEMEAECHRLRWEREGHLTEIRRLEDALEELRDDASCTERRQDAERERLQGLADGVDSETCRGLRAELERERKTREDVERRAEELEARAQRTDEELRRMAEAVERSAALERGISRARSLQATAVAECVGFDAAPQLSGRGVAAEVLTALNVPAGLAAEELAAAAWSCASLTAASSGVASSAAAAAPVMAALAAPLAAGALAELPPHSLCDVAWAFAQQAHVDAPLYTALSTAARRSLSGFAAHELAGLLESMVLLERAGAPQDGPLLLSMSSALAERVGELSPQAMASVARSLADSALSSGKPFDEATPLPRALCAAAVPRVAEFASSDLASAAASLAALGVHDAAWERAVAAEARRRGTAELTTRDLARLGAFAAVVAGTKDRLESGEKEDGLLEWIGASLVDAQAFEALE